MRINRLIKTLGDFEVTDDFEVKGIACNSKAVLGNFVFVAIKGNKADGNKFIGEAVDRGARAIVHSPQSAVHSKIGSRAAFIAVKDTRKALAVLAAKFYAEPSKKLNVIGVTGTNGKTTVTYLIESLLKKMSCGCGVIGTVNYRLGNEIIPSKNTTPGPVELESMLAKMAEQSLRYCVMEVSSHALDQERVAGINFASAIFTNLTQDHLDYHKTIKNYFESKARLFRDIRQESFAVINIDDKFGARLKELTNAKVITYGIDNKADVFAEKIEFGISQTRFRIVYPKGDICIASPLIGRHNVYNVLAAAAWAQEAGFSLSGIKTAIEAFSCVPGRLERIDSRRGFSVFVDYAHTDDALKNVIGSLRRIATSKSKINVVFGCGGERDKAKRPKMGKVVTELSDYAIITNDNPRSEEPLEIIADIKRGIRKRNFCVIPQRRAAIRKALLSAESGDIVLIAGKGHENYQVIKGKTLDFDDREVVKECLKSMNC